MSIFNLMTGPKASVAGGPPVNTAVPLIFGSVSVGSALTTTSGSWTNAPTSYAYKWQSSEDGEEWTDIPSGTLSTFTLTEEYLGLYIRSLVRATNASGTSSWAASETEGPVTAPSAADYFIANDAEWDTFKGLYGGTEGGVINISGKTVEFTGNLTSVTLTGKQFSTQTTFRGAAGARPIFEGTFILSGVNNSAWQHLEFYQPGSGDVINHGGVTCTNTVIEDFLVQGTPYDPMLDYSDKTDYAALIASTAGYGVNSIGNTGWDGFVMKSGTFKFTRHGVKGTFQGGPIWLHDIVFDTVMQDEIHFASLASNPIERILMSFCHGIKLTANSDWNTIPLSVPSLHPHGDHAQLNGTHKNVRILACIFVVVTDLSPGRPQGIFMTNTVAPAWLTNASVAYCIVLLPDAGSSALNLERSKSGGVYRSFFGRETPGTGGSSFARIFYSGANAGDNLFVECIAEQIDSKAGVYSRNNTVIANNLGAYQALLGATTFQPQSIQDVIDMYATTPMWNNVDWVNKTIDHDDEDPCLVFPAVGDVTPGTTWVYSDRSRVKFGPDTMAYLCDAGLECAISDDMEGTNEGAYGTSGTVARDKFFRVRAPAHATDGGVALTKNLTVNGYANPFTVVTATEMTYASTVFDGTNDYLVKAGALTGAAASAKFTMFVDWTPGGKTSGSNVYLFKNNGLRFGINHLANGAQPSLGGNIRIRGVNPAGTLVLSVDVPTSGLGIWEGSPHELMISVDLSAPDQGAGLQVYFDGADMTPAGGTFTVGETIDFAAADGWYLGRGNNTELYDMEHRVTHLLIGQALNLADASVRAKYLGENIGVNGEGPGGVTPAIYMVGNAASLNGGTGNKGAAGVFTVVGAVVDA